MDSLDFSKYESANSKFNAELSNKGGYITFSNSGKGGNKKFFTLSLESFLACLKDILENLKKFKGHERYIESEWRDLGSTYYQDPAANAQCTVQTKPMFATLSKIIIWANSLSLEEIDPEEYIVLESDKIKNAIETLSVLSNTFIPATKDIYNPTIENEIIFSEKYLRLFAKRVFEYFYKNKWNEIFNQTNTNSSKINDIDFVSHDYNFFKRIFGEFDSNQSKESLTSSNTNRFFEDPIYIEGRKFYYFSTQWNGNGDYSLSFKNLKNYFEFTFPDFSIKFIKNEYFLLKKEKINDENFELKELIASLGTSGLEYNKELLSRFISSILTKPFLILTGLSGSGKTKIAQAFSTWICQSDDQFKIIPVGADWTNREPLLGYPNSLESSDYVKPDNGVLDLLLEATQEENQNKPHFLILDEMNLSHVERYFADFLSVMESGDAIKLYSGTLRQSSDGNDIPQEITWPKNLFIIGTVNIDETTYMFSPKVLDRANVIEFRITEGELSSYLSSARELNLTALASKGSGMGVDFVKLAMNKNYPLENADKLNDALLEFFNELKKTGAEFGYRTASEIKRYVGIATKLDPEWGIDQIIDSAIMQKLLPKLHGSRSKLISVLTTLAKLCIEDAAKVDIKKDLFDTYDTKEFASGMTIIYPISLEKICRMYKNVIANGFTSYAEA